MISHTYIGIDDSERDKPWAGGMAPGVPPDVGSPPAHALRKKRHSAASSEYATLKRIQGRSVSSTSK